jgi:alkaline phosphatase
MSKYLQQQPATAANTYFFNHLTEYLRNSFSMLIRLILGRQIAFLLSVFCFTAFTPHQEGLAQVSPIRKIDKRPKRVILMIGDGMGLQQVTAGMYKNQDRLNLEASTTVGFHKSYSADELIADSAASATAMASGVKTKNGYIGLDEKEMPVKTLFELAKDKEIPVGIITNATLTFATPAAFVAHANSGEDQEALAPFYLENEIDFMVGGGKKYFADRKSDRRNLYQELIDKGYQVSDYSKQPFGKGSFDINQNYAFFLAEDLPEDTQQSRKDLITACKLAPSFLKNHGEGKFLLMIEDALIDQGGKANDSDFIIEEMINFDKAIGEILQFAKQDRETLVIITGDHEIGGYAINPGSTRDSILGFFISTEPTASMLPVFAYGPGAELFSGIYENTDIYRKIKYALGL